MRKESERPKFAAGDAAPVSLDRVDDDDELDVHPHDDQVVDADVAHDTQDHDADDA
jgi:hypothetical protein